MSRLLKRLRGVSSLVAVVVLIAVVIVGGFLLFWMVQNNLFRQSPAAKLFIDTSQLVRDTAGNVIFSTVIKNSGSKPCKTINITLNGENVTSYDLSTEPLEPGHTIVLAPKPTEVYVLGDTYPVTIVGVFSDGSSFSLSQTVTCTGAGGYIEKKTIIFDSEGLDSSASGTVLTVDGAAYDFSSLPLSFNWLRGTTHSFEWADSVATTNPEERFLWLSTTGLSSKRAGTVVVSFDGTIKATYEIFATRSITFNYEGIGGSTATMLKVDDTDYAKAALPKTFYWANGSTHTFSWYATVSGVSETQYVWTSTTGLSDKLADTLIVSVSGDVNATYKTQYLLTVVINPASGGAVDLSSGWFDAGTIVNATATPAGNYIFADWILDGLIHTENPITLTFNRSYSLTAEFILMANVTFGVSDMQTDAVGTVLTIDEKAEYLRSDLPKTFSWVVGSSHTFSWAPQVSDDTGKRYLWVYSTGLSTAQSGMISVAADGGNVTAFYNTVYLVNITTSTGGTTDPAPGTYWRASGTVFDILAEPESSYVLDYWEIDGVPGGNATVLHLTVDKAYSVRAVFRLSTVQVTFEASGLTSDASGTVITIDGVLSLEYADLPKTFDWVIGSTHTYAYSSLVLSAETGKRFSLSSVTGPMSPLTVTSPVTVTGNYAVQWLVTFTHTGLDSSANSTVVTVDGAEKGFGDLPFSKWVDHGSTVTYSYSNPVTSSTFGKRFSFTGATGPASPITMNSPATITGNYIVQWLVTFTHSGLDDSATGTVVTVESDFKTFVDLPFSNWFDSGTSVSYSYSGIIASSTPNKQFRFSSVTGPSSPITVNSAITVTGNYVVQWQVTFTHSGLDSSANGTVVTVEGTPKTFSDMPYSIWVDHSSVITYEYTDTVSSSTTDKHFVLTGVTGPASPITVTAATTVTGNYVVQWKLTFSQTGMDSSATGTVVTVDTVEVPFSLLPYSKWVSSGATVVYSFSDPVLSTTPTDKRFDLVSVSGTASPITVSSAETITGNYVVQWRLTFTHTGLDDKATGTVVSIEGLNKTYSDLPYTTWFDAGATVNYVYSDPVSSSIPGKRFDLTSITGPASPITVNSAATITGVYKAQWLVTFTHSGLDNSATGTVVTINGLNKSYEDLPFAEWYNEGASITYSYIDPVLSSVPDKQFDLLGVTGSPSPITVSTSETITGNYAIQWRITFTHSGLDSLAEGSIVTVDGLEVSFSSLPYYKWVYNGSSVIYAYSSIVSSSVDGKRFNLTSVTGPASPITVSSAVSVTGNYIVQWLVTFTYSGLDDSATGTVVTIGGSAKTHANLPFSEWYNSGASITYAYADFVSSSIDGKRFKLTGVTGPSSPITVNAKTTVSGSYSIQWLVTFAQTGLDDSATGTVVIVDTSEKAYSNLPFIDWYDKGTIINYVYMDPVSSTIEGKRFDLISVDGPASPITVNSKITVTGTYNIQWNVTFSQTGVGTDFVGTVVTLDGTPYDRNGASFWWGNGSSHTFSFESLLVVTSNEKRYSWNATSGLSLLREGSIIVSGSGTITGNYKTQYHITFAQTGVGSDFSGTVVIIDGENYDRSDASFWWYDASTHSFSFQSSLVVTADVKRYVWNTTAGISNSMSDSSFIVSSFGSITGNYKTQYYITFAQTGVDADFTGTVVTVDGTGYGRSGASFWWYDGSSHSFLFASPLVVTPNEKQYVWTTTTGLSTLQSNDAFVVSGSGNVTGNYRTQYYVTFTQSGVESDFTGTVVTIDSTPYDRNGVSFWWDSSSSHSFSFDSPLTVDAGKRYNWTSTSGLSTLQGGSIVISASGIVTGNYGTQWNVTFTHTGLDSSSNERIVTVSVLGDLYYVDLPYSYWVTSGTTVTYSYYQYTGSLTAGKRFSLTSVSGPASPITVDAKTTVAGNYVVQYSLTITVTPLAGGSTSPAVGTYWYDMGTNVQVTATPAGSYRFDHWRLDGSDAGSANPIFVSMTAKHSLEAVFIETAGITFNVSGITSGYSGNVLTVSSQSYKLSELPKTFTQDVGSSLAFAWGDPLYDGSDKRYVWSSTSGLVTTRIGFITVPSGGGVVDAVYGTEYRLLISVADPTQGTTDPAPGDDIWYSSTASAIVTASPSSGFAFDYWSLDGVANTANPITVPMSTNHTLVAHFMTAVFYKWSDGTTASSISLSYNLFNNTWTHDSNATYGIKSTGVYSTLNVHIYLASISNSSVVENVTFIIRDGAGVVVATVTWAGGSLPTAPVSLSLATNVVYTIEVWIKGKATVSDVSVGVNITIP